MPREVIREFLRPQDRLDLNFAESFATHCVALYTPTGEIKIEPIEGRHDTLPTSRGRNSSRSFGHVIRLKDNRSKSSAASIDKVGCV